MTAGQIGTGQTNSPTGAVAGVDLNAEYQAIAQRYKFANEALEAVALEYVDRINGKDDHKMLNGWSTQQLVNFIDKTYTEYLATDMPKWQYAIQNNIGDKNTNSQVLQSLFYAQNAVQGFRGSIAQPNQSQSYMNIYNQNMTPMNGSYNMGGGYNNNALLTNNASTNINPALVNPGGKFSNNFGIGNMYS